MSRLFLVTLLLALLSVSLASLLSFPSSDLAASPADCPSSCSQNGQCMKSGDASSCICSVGYLGVDCSVKTSMRPLCWLSGTFCTHWAVQGGFLYQRVWANSTNATGWAGVGWGSTDGMSGLQSTILSVLSAYAPTAFDGYNSKKGRPTNLTQQSVSAQNVSGGATPSGIDVSFIRLLDTGLAQHYTIPSTNGSASTMSVAWAGTFFDFHGKNAHFIPSIDIVGVASQAAVEEAKVHNRHGRLSAFMLPQ